MKGKNVKYVDNIRPKVYNYFASKGGEMVELEFSQALEAPNKVFNCNCSFPLNLNNDVFAPNIILGDASVMLKYFVDYDAILHLDGNVRVPCKFVCDRCCSNYSKNLFLEFSEKVEPSMNEDSELTYDMPKIELDEIISSYVLLNFPTKNLCRDDCKGLCSTCGANLNDIDCGCSKNKIGKNNPFADLFKSTKLGGK